MSRPQHVSRRAKPGVESLESRVVLSSFTLDYQGNLFQSTQSGPVKIDSGVASFAVAPNGTLYDRHSDGTMEKFANQTLVAIDSGVTAFALGSDGAAYALHVGGSLRNITAGGQPTVETDAFKMAGRTDGTIFYLTGDGRLVQYGPAPGTTTMATRNTWTGAENIAMAADGTLYELAATGQILANAQGTAAWQTILSPSMVGRAMTIALAPDGTLDELNVSGAIWSHAPGATTWQAVLSPSVAGRAITMAMAPDGTIYQLNVSGSIWSHAPGASATNWQSVLEPSAAGHVITMAMAADGTVYELNVSGAIWSHSPGATTWQAVLNPSVAGRAIAMTMAPNGTVYELNVSGAIWSHSPGNTSWQAILNPSVAGRAITMAMTPDGVLYELNVSGAIWSQAPSGAWSQLASNAVKMALDSNGNIDYLTTDHRLVRYNVKTGATGVWASTEDFALAPDGALYWLSTGGLLQRLNQGSSSWENISNNVTKLATRNDGNVYYLTTDHRLVLMNVETGDSGVWGTTADFAIAPDGALYWLSTYGLLQRLVEGSSSWENISNSSTYVTKIATRNDGNVYYLTADHRLVLMNVETGDSGVWGTTADFAIAPDGALYWLSTYGLLQRLVEGSSSWENISNSSTYVTKIATRNDGNVYYLTGDNQLVLLNLETGNSGVWGTTADFAIAPDGTLFWLSTYGLLQRLNEGSSNWQSIDTLVSSFSVDPFSQPIINDWFSANLPDPAVQSLVRQDLLSHGKVTRSDFLAGIYPGIEADGTVSANEFTSLQAIAGTTLLNIPGDVQNLAGKVVNGNPANAHYQGTNLGNLGAGSSASQLQRLVNKWFLGLDHPMAVTSYASAGSTLVGNSGFVYNDVDQGYLGDCTYLATIAEVAARSNVFGSTFIINGDNTWSVRFYKGGTPDYVTVDNQLPSGGGYYDHPFGDIWVALLEKALAEVNEEGWLNTLQKGVNSYGALDGGTNTTIAATFSALANVVAGDVSPGGNAADVAAAMQQGKMVVLCTQSPVSAYLVPYHAYALVGYNASSSTPFTLFNPWGIHQTTKPGMISANGPFVSQNFAYGVQAGSGTDVVNDQQTNQTGALIYQRKIRIGVDAKYDTESALTTLEPTGLDAIAMSIVLDEGLPRRGGTPRGASTINV